MLAIDRQRQIIELLDQYGSVRTIDLAERLSVTNETIRRDLERLEREGLLRRSHGGATSINARDTSERSFDERNVQNLDAKQKIAQAALKLIEPGDSIFVDASSTALQLVLLLGDFPLQVITHSLYVAECLRRKNAVDLVFAGGRLDRTSRSFLGPEALLSLKRYRVDKAFCSGNGIEPSLGASEINRDQAILKEVVCHRATRFVYLVDHTKLGRSSSFYFAEGTEIDLLITDAPQNHPILTEIGESGTEIVSTAAS